MGKVKFQPHHLLKLISVGLFSVVLLAIAASLMTRSKRQVRIPEIARSLEDQKIDRKEQIEIRGMKRDEESLEVLADRHFIGEDGLYHLEGNVKISFFKRSEGQDIILKGEEILHNEDRSHFWLNGKAIVQFKDLIVESSVLEYDTTRNVFRTDETVRFFSESISGSARKFEYFLGEKKAELLGDVRLQFRSTLEKETPLEVDSEYFEYYVGKGRGKAEGDVVINSGKSQATAGLMEFRLSASREQIKTLFLKDRVRISLVDEFEEIDPAPDRTSVALHRDNCQIEAQEVLIRGFVEMPRIQRIESSGLCSFRFSSKTGSYTQIDGDEIVLELTKGGKLKSLTVDNNAKIVEENREEKSFRSIDGQKVLIQEDKNVLIVEGKDVVKAKVRSKDSEIEAEEIRLFLDKGDIEADKSTKVIIYPTEKSLGGGFFSPDNPVFITAADMRYFAENKRFKFIGGAKLWQIKETIKGEQMIFDGESGAFRADGSVESILPYVTKEKKEEESVRIESGTMVYDPANNTIVYSEDVKLRTKDVLMTSKLLTIALDEESGDMMSIVARTDVVILQKTYEGHGEEANFDIHEEVITVTGNPVLIDKDRGKTEGGKLTFSMADGRIVVENKDRERSVTVIKF